MRCCQRENFEIFPHRTSVSHAQPKSRVARVTGKPVRKYSRKPIITSGRARSTTMILATEPVIVRLPDNVLAIANINHALCGSANPGMRDFKSMTAGTLLRTLDKLAVTTVKLVVC